MQDIAHGIAVWQEAVELIWPRWVAPVTLTRIAERPQADEIARVL
jgi:hypothetical protein